MQVRRLRAMGRDRVDVEVEGRSRARHDLEIGETGLLEHLASRRGEDRLVLGLDMTTGLQPASELRVVHLEQGIALGREHERARREVTGLEAVAPKGVARRLDQLEHLAQRILLALVERTMRKEQGVKLRASVHAPSVPPAGAWQGPGFVLSSRACDIARDSGRSG